MGGVKLWVPPPVVKFGCLMHDEQLSSSASRICRMVAVASIQIAFFVAPVPGPRRWLSMVFLILCTRWCLNVRERRAPESQTPPIFPRFPPSLASLASLSLLLLLSAPLPLPLPAARCPLWWLIGVASRHFVSHFIVRWCFRILKESDHAMSELCGVSISQVPPVCVNSVTNWLPSPPCACGRPSNGPAVQQRAGPEQNESL